jgi:hypothetical protein
MMNSFFVTTEASKFETWFSECSSSGDAITSTSKAVSKFSVTLKKHNFSKGDTIFTTTLTLKEDLDGTEIAIKPSDFTIKYGTGNKNYTSDESNPESIKISLAESGDDNGGDSEPVAETVATPTFSPASGSTVTAGSTVTISCETEDAAIYYTTDSTTPTAQSTLYTQPITLNAETTIKAIGIKAGCTDSEVATATYMISALTAPTFSQEAGAVTWGTTVAINTTLTGATIYYTTDGSNPTDESGSRQTYSAPIAITANTTIQAVTYLDGTYSGVSSASYTVPDLVEPETGAFFVYPVDNQYRIGITVDKLELDKDHNTLKMTWTLLDAATFSSTTEFKFLFGSAWNTYFVSDNDQKIVSVSDDYEGNVSFYSGDYGVIYKSPTVNVPGGTELFSVTLTLKDGFSTGSIALNPANWTVKKGSTELQTTSSEKTLNIYAVPAVPTISLAEDAIAEENAVAYGTQVTLASATSDATVYYRTYAAGTQASGDFAEYQSALTITADTTVEAYATSHGQTSATTSQTFTMLTKTLTASASHGSAALQVDGGTVSSGSTVIVGKTVTVTATPDNDYNLTGLTVSGTEVSLTTGENNSIAFTMPNADITVNAEFTKASTVSVPDETDKTLDYTVTYDTDSGTYTVQETAEEGEEPVSMGTYSITHETVTDTNGVYDVSEQVVVSVTPAEGYQIKGVYYTDTYHTERQEASIQTAKSYVRRAARATSGTNAVNYVFQAKGDINVHVVFEKLYNLTADQAEDASPKIDHFEVDGQTVTTAVAGTTVTAVITGTNGENYFSGLVLSYQDGNGEATSQTVMAVTFTMPASDVSVRAVFGSGTVSTIANVDELLLFANSVNAGLDYAGTTVTLTASIDLSQTTWTPIGTAASPFKGTFDGGGLTISGINIQGSDQTTGEYLGLFGYTDSATIKNVSVAGSITTEARKVTDSDYVGGIVGYGKSTTITACTSNVQISSSADSYVGGIAGYLSNKGDAVVEDCINYGSITTDRAHGYGYDRLKVGGLVGFMSGVMNECGNYGTVYVEGGTYTDSNTKTGVKTVRDYCDGDAGGLVGMASGLTITNSFNKASVTGDMNFGGGLVGSVIVGLGTALTMQNCYNLGDVIEDGDAGRNDCHLAGLVGYVYGSAAVVLNNCYSTGECAILKSSYYTITTNSLYNNTNKKVSATNCYDSTTVMTEEAQTALAAAGFNVSGGLPPLSWESGSNSTVVTGEQMVTFQLDPADATVELYTDMNRTAKVASWSNGEELAAGTYYYRVSKTGYQSQEGSLTVTVNPVTRSVSLKQASTVTFKVTPAAATFVLYDISNKAVAADTSSGGTYTFQLAVGDVYTYEASYETDSVEYITVSHQLEVPAYDKTIEVTLEQKKQAGGTIYGDGNTDETNTITAGGSYFIGEGATGTITIETTDAVTLVGGGTSKSAMYENLYINCTEAGADLTLQDVYISVEGSGDADSSVRSILDFTGKGNALTFSGTNVLDMDTNATYYAAIHVGKGTDLTITGGTAYIYKNEQAAAIGGGNGSAESNGTITIRSAELYIKGTKQGALIGPTSGANCSGDINIYNSDLYLIANARGAAIGGSAGSSGASSGGTVTITGSRVNINVDYSGAAIGGGGYDGGNDASGGTLVVSNSSIRAYIDANATSSWGVTSAGVNGNKAITANIVNSKGESLYLLTVDTSSLSGKSFTIKEGNTTVYSGGLHTEQYIGSDTGKTSVTYTQDNWTSLNDPNLYLYLTGEDHELTINGDTYRATWNASSKTFTLQKKNYENVTTIESTTVVSTDGVATVSITEAAVTEALKAAAVVGNDVLYLIADETSAIADSTKFAVDKDILALIAEAEMDLVCVTNDGTKVTLPVAALRTLAGLSQTVKTSFNGSVVRTTLAATYNAASTTSNEVAITVTPMTKAEAEAAIKGTKTLNVDDYDLDNTVAQNVTVEANGQAVSLPTGFTIDVPVSSTLFTKGSSYSVLRIGADGTTETLTAKCEEDDGSLYLHMETEEGGTFILLSTTPLSLYDDMVTITATTTVKNGAAAVTVTDDAVTDAISAAKKNKLDTLVIVTEPDSTKITSTSFTISRKALNSINAAEMGLVLETYDGTRTTLSDTAMASIADKAEKENVTITVTPKTQSEALTALEGAKDLDAVDFDLENCLAIEILIQSNDKTITGADDGFGVYLPVGSSYSKGSKYQVLWIGADGSSETLTGTCVEWNGQRYLNFKADESGTFVVAADATVSYTDVAEDDWFYDAVAFVTRRGLMTGTATGVFSPKVDMTRAMLVTVLYRMEGSPANESSSDFIDVIDGSWYADAVIWAKTNGIVDGYGNGQFGPGDKVTREQTALILMRYAQYKGYDVTATADLSAYSDAADIDSWALTAMQWTNATGLIQGLTDGTLAPRSSTQRSQMATLLMRYIQKIVE